MVVIVTSVTLMVTSSPVVVPLAKYISDTIVSLAPAYPEHTLATAYRDFSNKIFSPKTEATNPELRNTLEQELQTKGYTEKFLKLLNDHSIIALGRKEGLAVKDWRI